MCDKLPSVERDVLIEVTDLAMANNTAFIMDVCAQLDNENPHLAQFLLNYFNNAKDPEVAQSAVTIFLVLYRAMSEQLKINNEIVS